MYVSVFRKHQKSVIKVACNAVVLVGAAFVVATAIRDGADAVAHSINQLTNEIHAIREIIETSSSLLLNATTMQLFLDALTPHTEDITPTLP